VLIDDATSGAGVIIEPSQIRGILRGAAGGPASGQVQIDNLTPDSRIKPGDQVLTSGGDMVFPRGLPVGVIQSIAPDPGHQPYTAVTVKPAANLQQLSEVLVITAMQSTLPPAAQADAAQAESTALANQRAADILAARLPSLHASPANGAATTASGAATDAGTAPSPANTNNAGNPAPPKPQPVLHPDRFSPGATPPAQDLTPGETTQPATQPDAAAPKSSAAQPQQL
jgi:rod shape-determining protein MreC